MTRELILVSLVFLTLLGLLLTLAESIRAAMNAKKIINTKTEGDRVFMFETNLVIFRILADNWILAEIEANKRGISTIKQWELIIR